MNRQIKRRRHAKCVCHLLMAFSLLGLMIHQAGRTQAQTTPPRVVLNTGGPAGQIRQLRFSSDSQRLYAAGLDKSVHVYEVGWNRGDGGPPELKQVSPMYWEQARGDRGSIYSLALNSRQREMVLGGVGARQQTGDIALFDLGRGLVAGCLPSPEQRTTAAAAKRIGTEGHLYAVMSLDYSPDGNRIVSRDERGGLVLWQRGPQGGFDVTVLRPPNPQASRFAPLAIFTSDQNVVYSRQDPDGQVRLISRSLRTGNEAPFTESYHGRVAALTRDHRHVFWASADGLGRVYLSDVRDPANRHVIRASLPHVTAIAMGDNALAVLSNEFSDGRAGNVVVELFDLATRRRVDAATVSTTEYSRALAISPDGRFLAVSKEDPRSILVFPLTDTQDRPLARPLSEQPPLVARANTQPTNQLALSPDGRLLGFGRDPGSIFSSLDLALGEIRSDQPPSNDWMFPVTQSQGWQVTRVNRPTTQLRLVDPTGKPWLIDLNPTFQGTYFSHCFLFTPASSEPVGIAIGTEHVNGIFVYRFSGNTPASSDAFAPPMVRWYRDHTGTITSLIASPDGRTLFSGSQDNTIKLWRLGGVFSGAGAGEFEQASFWGCDFEIINGNVVVRRVDPEGIAFARSLREGDRITRIQGYDRRDLATILDAQAGTASAEEIRRVLGQVSVLRQNLIYADSTRPNGQNETKRFIIRPSWEPFLTAFANENDQWAIWHPSGFFNASAAEGGGLFEWMILRGADRPPRMVEGGFLAKEFERPETILKLISGVNIADAVAGEPPIAGRLAGVIDSTPEVTILSPEIGQGLSGGQPNVITAHVDFGTGNPANYDVRANIDAVRLPDPEIEALPNNQFQYTWTVNVSGRLNQIQVIAKERGGALASLYASDVAYRRGETDRETPYRLHVLSLASEDYSGPLANHRNGFGRLEFPIDDVDAIVKTLRDKQLAGLGRYQLGNIRELRDDQITQESVANEIRRLNDQLRAKGERHILIVYLSGHGTTIDGEYHYVTTTSRSADPVELRRGSLPWSLLDGAGESGTGVIYMIDTCHSGSAVDAKSSIRDPLQSGGVVIAAASGRESAKELAPLEHGCFTFSVLAALDGDADGVGNQKGDGANGIVDLEELVSFVRDYVGQLTAGEQKPTVTPLRLSDTLRLELVRTAK
ncbi:caspase family protein [Aporhodopirellula aestuarii]|uniref:Caspase family protein n=1 Tax=Aporhodopirellula aestuarii TaxID=2950107 RepID=A0ABT0U929_9BACT|nr:caspase family protein [Aporhodopirellula aestuarii]MCM2372908.1 caspase family protein [Aporhodopirellula aestuarii]